MENEIADNNRTDNGKKDTRFKPGNPGKPKGSSKNKMRDQIRKFINDHWDNMPTWFEELKPKEKFDVILSLMPYSVSRLQSISMTDSDGNDGIPSLFPFGGYVNELGQWVPVGDASYYLSKGKNDREAVASLFPPELKDPSQPH